MNISRFGLHNYHRQLFVLAQTILAISICACGGGSGSQSQPPTPVPSFSISATPPNPFVDAGQSVTVSLSVTAINGFNQPISVSLTGLPSGVTSLPSSPFTMTTAGQQVTFTVSPSAALGTTAVKFTGTSGSEVSSASTGLTIGQAPPGFPNDRASFVRTDDPPAALVYDPVHQLIFAGALHLNCVDVISPSAAQPTKCIPVPAPLGLSLSSDGTQVLVGTQVGKVAWIDASRLEVVQWDTIPPLPPAPGIGGFNYLLPMQPVEAANGKVFLFSGFGFTAVPPGYVPTASAAEWDPTAGTTKVRPDAPGGDLVSASSDHTKILVAGNGDAALYSSATDQFTPLPSFSLKFALLNPAGSQIAVVSGTPLVTFFNLLQQQVGSVAITDCCLFGPVPNAVFSLDSKYLYLNYVAQDTGVPKLVTIDASTFQIVGVAPNLSTELAYVSSPSTVASPQAADSSGLIFEVADHGVGIADATDFRTFQNAEVVADFIVATPDEGPLSESTFTQFTTGIFSTLPDVFFGSQTGVGASLNTVGQLQATAPPSASPGPVNVKAIQGNGVLALMPQAFTYGSIPIQYGDLALDPKGGLLADLFGYGYSVDRPGAAINVTVGSATAGVQHQDLFPSEVPYPFPLQHLVVSLPAGSPGAQDVTVTSPAGTATAPKAVHYVTSVTDYSSKDGFLFPLYDQHRNQLYLSAGDHIDVFSLATNSFSAPITIPSSGGSRLILGLALTPDGSKLLVANQSDQSVAIINPDNPGSGAVAVTVPPNPEPGFLGPFEVAATSTNQAFVTLAVENGDSGGGGGIYALDLSTNQVSLATLPAGSILGLNGNYIAASADGTAVLEATANNSGGPVLSWRAATNTWQLHLVEGQFWDGAAISGDGNVLAIDSSPEFSLFPFPYMLDPQLNLTAQVNFPEFQSIAEGPSPQLEQSGALLYDVNGAGVDIIDARTGQLRERVLLSEQVGGTSAALPDPVSLMAITPAGDKIFLLTNAGLTLVQLDAVPLGIGSITPGSGAAGSSVTVRGSGFVAGTSVAVNGISAAVSFVDSSTLKVTVPSSVPGGAVQFVLTNPDNSNFSLDAAFLVQ